MEPHISITQIILSLLMVCGLIGLCAFMLKWLSEKTQLVNKLGSTKRIKLLDSSALDHKHKVFIVACDDTEYTLVSNGTQMEVLGSSLHPRESGDPYHEEAAENVGE